MPVALMLPRVFQAEAMTAILSASSTMLTATTTEKSGQDLVRIVFPTHQPTHPKKVITTLSRVLVPLLGTAMMKLRLIPGVKPINSTQKNRNYQTGNYV